MTDDIGVRDGFDIEFTHHSAFLVYTQFDCMGRTFLPIFISAFIGTSYLFSCSQAAIHNRLDLFPFDLARRLVFRP